jgi:hypothetical protein
MEVGSAVCFQQEMLETLKVICAAPFCTLAAMEGRLCLREVREVLEVLVREDRASASSR